MTWMHSESLVEGYLAATLERGVEVDGLVAASAYELLGARAALDERGLEVPVVCCEDVPLLEYLRPRTMAFGVAYSHYARPILDALGPEEPARRQVVGVERVST